jgi:thymidine kinase
MAAAAAEPLNEQLELICGSMYSGKSTELLRRVRRFRCAGKRVLLVKPALDTRYSADHVTTHDKLSEAATVVSRLADLALEPYDMCAIDEAQFYPDLASAVPALMRRHPAVRFVVAGLNATYLNRPFSEPEYGDVWSLGSLASNVTFLHGVCSRCGYDGASRSARVVPSNGEVRMIGGVESYACMCQRCHSKYNQVK